MRLPGHNDADTDGYVLRQLQAASDALAGAHRFVLDKGLAQDIEAMRRRMPDAIRRARELVKHREPVQDSLFP